METNKTVTENGQNIFIKHGDAITKACDRAVREALRKHKLAGNPIAVARDGQVVLLSPDEIEID
jgi:hypothetical protein